MLNKYDVISIDECSFNNEVIPKKIWNRIGTEAILLTNESKSINNSLLLAVSYRYGIIAY